MKLRILIAAVLMSLTMLACSAGGNEWSGDPQLVYKLQLKMTEADVRGILGEPSEVEAQEMLGQQMVIWQYHGKERVGVVFQNGKLVGSNLGFKTVLQAGAADL